MIRYKGAKIQLLDLPGIIEGAKDGKGRGRQVTVGQKPASGPPDKWHRKFVTDSTCCYFFLHYRLSAQRARATSYTSCLTA